MNTNETIIRDPRDLKPHPDIKGIPRWERGSEEFNAFRADIRHHAIQHPLLITSDDLVIDGETRRLAALSIDLREVPCVIVPVEQTRTIILRELLQRRHLTKGALAYLAVPLMEEALREAMHKRALNLKRGEQMPDRASGELSGIKNVDQLAESLGLSRTTFAYACALHDAFRKRPELRAQFEPKILAGEIGLGAVKAGIGGQDATKGKARTGENQLDLFEDVFATMKVRFKYWGKFQPAEKEKLQPTIRQTVKDMPEDLREEFARALRLAKKEQEV